MRRMQAFSRAFKVYELDDYLPNVPLKSAHRQHLPKDILRTLRRGLGYVDRFVVSTPALAEAFAGFHPDIRVIENRLPVGWWQGLRAQRRRGERPRVGWAGGSSHTGDLELIADVVRELADEVDWVFFGMCPPSIRPFVREVHAGCLSNAIRGHWRLSISTWRWRRWSRTCSTSARAICACWNTAPAVSRGLQRRALLPGRSAGDAGEEPFPRLGGRDPHAYPRPGCRGQGRGSPARTGAGGLDARRRAFARLVSCLDAGLSGRRLSVALSAALGRPCANPSDGDDA